MTAQAGIRRKAHFLGTKLRSLRKRNNLTLEDLSVRCIHVDAMAAPSISYLSMIENGKRVPSEPLLQIFADIFQKDLDWFYDETIEDPAVNPLPGSAVRGLPLEPGFLFSQNLLQRAIPELLSQTGTTGRQFAHLLIRAYQESNQNQFPDIERAAERIGRKRFPLSLDDVIEMTKQLGLEIRWFTQAPFRDPEDGMPIRTVLRSFFEAPGRIYLNRELKRTPFRVKFELANQLAHKVLHGGDGARAPQVSGGRSSHRADSSASENVDAQDILHAWRDFECSYFAAALLAPKTPFRQFLAKYAHATNVGQRVDLSTTLVMRRMSSVSPYPHWHYFDAYPPGTLRAVYRGNGIPLPWGNMNRVSDPCQHWAVFRMLGVRGNKPATQISVLRNGTERRLYCCESVRNTDAAGNPHVLCAGIDLAPALLAQGVDVEQTIADIESACEANGGAGPIPPRVQRQLESIGHILNIGWIAHGAHQDATIICPRSSGCPRKNPCLGTSRKKARPGIEELCKSISAAS
ncbi:MAG: DUF3612 domain-containing protein [Xanthomonadales bacterium]|nr:DUF3612 domain-containing protein [Xanthomonadales bacterium]